MQPCSAAWPSCWKMRYNRNGWFNLKLFLPTGSGPGCVTTKGMARLWTVLAFVSCVIPAIDTFQLSLPGLLNTRTHFQKLPIFRPRSVVTTLKCLSENELSRRQVVNGLILQIVAAPLIQPASAESYVIKAPEGRPRNVIITGANSGEQAVNKLLELN